MVTQDSCNWAFPDFVAPSVTVVPIWNWFAFKALMCGAHYCSQKKAWVNTEIFSDWFYNQFIPEKSLTIKTLLVFDNAPSHPNAASLVSLDRNIKV